MTSVHSAQRQNINTQLVLIGFAVMTIAFAFVAVLTNMIVNSKVNALTRSYQNNPVTVAAAPQTNTIGATSCVAPGTTAVVADPGVAGAQTNSLPGVGGSVVTTASWRMPLGNYSQSNSSVTNTTSTNTFIKDSYNTTNTTTNTDNSDHSVDTSHSGNTHTDVDVNVSNTTTTTNTDNSNHSVNTVDSGNTATSTVTNTNNQNIGNTNNQNNEGVIGNNNDNNDL